MKRSQLILLSLAAALTLSALPAVAAGQVEFLNSGKVLPKGLPFSELVRHGNTLYLSGQIGILPGTTQLAQGGMKEEARQTLDNIKTTLEAHGYSVANLVKCIAMLTDMSEWPAFNDIYRTYFSGNFPARSAFGATALAFNARVELTCIGATDIS